MRRNAPRGRLGEPKTATFSQIKWENRPDLRGAGDRSPHLNPWAVSPLLYFILKDEYFFIFEGFFVSPPSLPSQPHHVIRSG